MKSKIKKWLDLLFIVQPTCTIVEDIPLSRFDKFSLPAVSLRSLLGRLVPIFVKPSPGLLAKDPRVVLVVLFLLVLVVFVFVIAALSV